MSGSNTCSPGFVSGGPSVVRAPSRIFLRGAGNKGQLLLATQSCAGKNVLAPLQKAREIMLEELEPGSGPRSGVPQRILEDYGASGRCIPATSKNGLKQAERRAPKLDLEAERLDPRADHPVGDVGVIGGESSEETTETPRVQSFKPLQIASCDHPR